MLKSYLDSLSGQPKMKRNFKLKRTLYLNIVSSVNCTGALYGCYRKLCQYFYMPFYLGLKAFYHVLTMKLARLRDFF